MDSNQLQQNKSLRKIIFLDVDGVLNPYCWIKQFHIPEFKGKVNCMDLLSPFCLINLRKIIDVTKAEIVLSSFWRYSERDVQVLNTYLEVFRIPAIDKSHMTKIVNPDYREDEIVEWLERNPDVLNYVIIDDVHEFEQKYKHFVQTDEDIGIDEECVAKAISILSNKELEIL